MYKKHRAFVLKQKFCAYLQSPSNSKCSGYQLPYVSYTKRCGALKRNSKIERKIRENSS